MATLVKSNSLRFKGPAYNYIRTTDKLPDLGTEAKMARVKLFDPTGSWTWFVSEYDPKTHECFGLVKGFEEELGYFNMDELIEIRGQFGLPLERDIHWTPRLLEEC
jgi:hypothetical protein